MRVVRHPLSCECGDCTQARADDFARVCDAALRTVPPAAIRGAKLTGIRLLTPAKRKAVLGVLHHEAATRTRAAVLPEVDR
jgi:hypothetical protein